MQKKIKILLQIITVAVAIGSLAALLVEPHFEGRNADATLVEIYFNDPFLAYAYGASIVWFLGLYQVFKLLGYHGDKQFSRKAIKALRVIQQCAIVSIALMVVGATILFLYESDDRPPIITMSILGSGIAAGISFTAAKYERILKRYEHE